MKKKNIFGTTITITVIVLTILLEIVTKTFGFFWERILGKIWKKP